MTMDDRRWIMEGREEERSSPRSAAHAAEAADAGWRPVRLVRHCRRHRVAVLRMMRNPQKNMGQAGGEGNYIMIILYRGGVWYILN
jgi:hypothetical protein